MLTATMVINMTAMMMMMMAMRMIAKVTMRRMSER